MCFPHKLKSIHFSGMHRMKVEREANVTQRELGKDIEKNAILDGRDIKRKGVTSPSSGPVI